MCALALCLCLQAYDVAGGTTLSTVFVFPRSRGKYGPRVAAAARLIWSNLAWDSIHFRHALRLSLAASLSTVLYTALAGGASSPPPYTLYATLYRACSM